MHSSLIGKVQKAREYANERHRMQIENMQVRFQGDNSDHEVSLVEGSWACNCDFFADWQVCSHTMALERILDGMVPRLALPATA